MKVKATKVPSDSKIELGKWYELKGTEMDALVEAGHEFATEAELKLVQATEASVEAAVKASKAFAPKDDAGRAKVKTTALKLEAVEPGSGVEYINSLPAIKASLGERAVTASGDEALPEISVGDAGLKETIKEYLHASEPFIKTHREGGIIRACKQDPNQLRDAISASRSRATVAEKLGNMIAAGADFRFDRDLGSLVKAADYADSALGVLNTGLTLQWNLGHLENQLAPLGDITTDVSNTPALFNQVVRTRYIAIPKGMLKTASNAWPNTGSPTGTDVDVNITMDSHFGVPISINNNILGSTARQLFNEQKTPQLYAMGEYITYKLVNCIMNGSTRIANDGTTTSTITFNPGYTNGSGGHTFSLGGATLATFVADLPEAMDESKFPGGDEQPGEEPARFVWVHGRVYSSIAADTNFILNQSIQGIKQASGENLIKTGRFMQIGNTKIRKSQLITDQCAVSGSGADAVANGITVSPGTYANATNIGFAGTRNSLLFCSRVPQDYTKAMPDIPNTAAIELVSSPQLGITLMVVKYLDHSYETANVRVQLMFGQAIGDERQGMLLTK